jgi:hypothetical protein
MNDDKQLNWHTIKIDSDVFSALQREARPLLDTPNDVLRRLLLQKASAPVASTKPPILSNKAYRNTQEISSEEFVKKVLGQRFGSGFSKVGRYVYMFESRAELVYFQNFNKIQDELWFRINYKERQFLATSPKQAWLCLTYPPGKIAFIFPVKAIEEQAKRSGWKREELEISIYHQRARWVQFNWDIRQFRFEVK